MPEGFEGMACQRQKEEVILALPFLTFCLRQQLRSAGHGPSECDRILSHYVLMSTENRLLLESELFLHRHRVEVRMLFAQERLICYRRLHARMGFDRFFGYCMVSWTSMAQQILAEVFVDVHLSNTMHYLLKESMGKGSIDERKIKIFNAPHQ